MTLHRRWPKDWPLQMVPRGSWTEQRPTYGAAQPSIISAALDRSQRRPTGNWYVFAASRDVRIDRPLAACVAGIELVAWRDQQRRLRVGPARCPHLGADLATGTVRDGVLFCRWHGLALDGNRASPVGRRCPATTTVCWRGCDSTPSAAKRRSTSRCLPPGRPATPCRRSPAWPAAANHATSSPTGSTLGMAGGYIPIRSPAWKCSTTPTEKTTALSSQSPSGSGASASP